MKSKTNVRNGKVEHSVELPWKSKESCYIGKVKQIVVLLWKRSVAYLPWKSCVGCYIALEKLSWVLQRCLWKRFFKVGNCIAMAS